MVWMCSKPSSKPTHVLTEIGSNRKVRAILISDADHFKAGHAVVVRILGHDGDVVGNCSRSDPGVVQGHPPTVVAKRQSECCPRVRDLRVDRQRIERLCPRESFEPSGTRRSIGRGEHAEAQLPDCDHRYRNLLRRCSGQSPLLLKRNEQRGIGDRDLGARAPAGHGTGTSSVVSGRSSASSRANRGSARQSLLPARNASQEIVRGRAGSGASSATGRPLTVTRSRSPASTRRRTPLTLFRRSRAGMSATRPL